MMSAVDEESFWRLIEDCTPDDPDAGAHGLAVALTETLNRGPVHRVVGFAEQLSWFDQFTSTGAEDLLYVPDQAYLHLTGEEWDRRTRYSYESRSNRDGWALSKGSSIT